ncbi:MAG: hypothetical protein AAGC53_12805 [Actinomycetota bacterium]
MTDIARSLLSVLVVTVVGLLVFMQLGIADLTWPWENPAVASQTTSIVQTKAAEIIEIEPITLDCRARIHTVVPVEGKRQHEMLGQTYRTDTVEMTAVGDIDTCVDATEVEVVVRDDGSARVLVPADAIEFVRPRVDAVATLDSVVYDEGLLGKLSGALPWVSDNSRLTPAAFAYAQTVIGSSECMEQAYELTTQAMIDAYEAQMAAVGLDPDDLEVEIIGDPNFDVLPDAGDLGDFEFETTDAGASCSVAVDALDGAGVPDDGR